MPEPINPSCVQTFVCRNCGEPRRDSNYWFVIEVSKLMPQLLRLHEWSRNLATLIPLDPDLSPVCGHNCAHVLLSRWMETRTLEAPAVRSEAANVALATRPAGGAAVPDAPRTSESDDATSAVAGGLR